MDNTKDGVAMWTDHNENFHTFNTSIPSDRGGYCTLTTRASHAVPPKVSLARPVDERELVHKAGDGSSKERRHPVNPVVGPLASDQRWPEAAGRIHGSPGDGHSQKVIY